MTADDSQDDATQENNLDRLKRTMELMYQIRSLELQQRIDDQLSEPQRRIDDQLQRETPTIEEFLQHQSLEDAHLIGRAAKDYLDHRRRGNPGYPMEMSRRLKNSVEALAAETIAARVSSERAGRRVILLTVVLVALTAALVALTVVLAVRS